MTLTAKHLGMSQSSISYHISELERELSVELLQRYNSGVALTEDGKILFEQVNRFIKLDSLTKHFTKAEPKVLTACVLHDSLVDFVVCNNNRKDKLNIEFHPMFADKDIFDGLEGSKFDFVVTPYIRTAQRFKQVKICKADYYLVASKCIDIDTLALEDIAENYPYIKYYCRKPFQREIATLFKESLECIATVADKYQALMLCEQSNAWTVFAIPDGLKHFKQKIAQYTHIKKLDLVAVDYYMVCQSDLEQNVYNNIYQLVHDCYGL